jgi:hypothetical protein
MNSFSSSSLRLLFAVVLAVAVPAQAQLPEVALSINGHRLAAEVASTEPARAQGLMHRRILAEHRGMLFVFADVAMHAMWMMNTHIPLSVAFLDERGVIINIEDMKPHTQDTHPAARPAKYALEANLGWFARRGIKPGVQVKGLEQAPPAR